MIGYKIKRSTGEREVYPKEYTKKTSQSWQQSPTSYGYGLEGDGDEADWFRGYSSNIYPDKPEYSNFPHKASLGYSCIISMEEAETILKNPKDFKVYLVSDSKDLHTMSDDEFAKCCELMAKANLTKGCCAKTRQGSYVRVIEPLKTCQAQQRLKNLFTAEDTPWFINTVGWNGSTYVNLLYSVSDLTLTTFITTLQD